MLRAFLILIFFGLINLYAAARIIGRWPWAARHMTGAWLVVLVFFVLQMLAPFGDRLVFKKLRKRPHMAAIVSALDWISYTAFGVMSLLVVYGIAIDIVRIALQLADPYFNLSIFDHYALYAIFTVTLATTVTGIAYVLRGPQVVSVTVPLAHLPPALDGFRIVQISDLHVGAAIRKRYVQNVVDIANGLEPDLIALTGDFVDGGVDDLMEDVTPLSALRAPEGVFFVTGNHEYYSGVHQWLGAFEQLGARILLNAHVVIRRGKDAFVLAGVTDHKASDIVPDHATDPATAIAGAPAGLVNILLAHQPFSYREAAKAGFDVQLSGHAHGGQYFPFTFLVRFFQHYYTGLEKYKNMWIYVSHGTGYWGPPFRTGTPCEITLITLRRTCL